MCNTLDCLEREVRIQIKISQMLLGLILGSLLLLGFSGNFFGD